MEERIKREYEEPAERNCREQEEKERITGTYLAMYTYLLKK